MGLFGGAKKLLSNPDFYTVLGAGLRDISQGGSANMAQAQRILEARRTQRAYDALGQEFASTLGGGSPPGLLGPPRSAAANLPKLPQRSMQGPGLDGEPISARPGYAGIGPGIDGAPLSNSAARLASLPGGRELLASQLPKKAEPSAGDEWAMRRDKLQAALIRAAGQGLDVGPFSQMLSAYETRRDRDAYLSGLPEAARAEAALDPRGYATWDREARLPMVSNVGGGEIVATDRRTGDVRRLYSRQPEPMQGYRWGRDGQTLEPIPGGPADPSVITRRARAERDGAPPEWVVNPDGPKGSEAKLPTTSTVVGGVLAKVASQGVDALTPGEKALWERYNRTGGGNGLEDLIAGGVGGDLSGMGAPPPPAASPARPPKAPAKVRQTGGVYYPQSMEDMRALPKGAKFYNPATKTVLTKAR